MLKEKKLKKLKIISFKKTGGDEWLRYQFKIYLIQLLITSKSSGTTKNPTILLHYNLSFT